MNLPFTSPKPLPPTSPNAQLAKGLVDIQDVIAPPAIEVDFDFLRIGNKYFRTLFVAGYPRFVSANWLAPLINFDHTLEIAMYIYPIEGRGVLDDLRRKTAEMEAEMQIDLERGRMVDPGTKAKLEDAQKLQEQLIKGVERFFQFGLYVTIPADSLQELNQISKQVAATLGSLLIVAKHATLQMEDGFKTTIPTCTDKLMITRNMDTTSLATTFPFTSSELTANEGILYGINEHNDSLIVFDRFTLENANSVIFGKAGSGKSIYRDCPILFDDGQGPRIGKIGPLVEGLIAKNGASKIEEGIEGVINPELKVFTFDQNLKGKWASVTVAARKRFSPRNRLYQITTQSGREITVTADHNLVVLRHGKIRVMRSEAVKTGERIPLSRVLPAPETWPGQINPKDLVDQWPDFLPQQIPLNKEILSLLGLITSEGYLGPQQLSVYNEVPLVHKAIISGAKILGAKIKPIFKNRGKNIKGFYLQPAWFKKLFIALGAGGKSGEKRVPPVIFSLSNKQVANYLRAYFEGDGETGSNGEVGATSKSKELVSDLTYLLLRFGIVARIRKKWKRATNTNHQGDYYYQLVISGQDNLLSFIKNVGFLNAQKNRRVEKFIKRATNTNVDTIPALEPILKKLYRALFSASEIKAPAYFCELMRGEKTPSREILKQIIKDCEGRIQGLKENRQKIIFLKSLPDLKELCQRTTYHRKLNRLAWQNLGQSWRLMKNQAVSPGLVNVLRLYQTVDGQTIAVPEVKETIYQSFAVSGLSLRKFDDGLWDAVTQNKNGDTQYQKVILAIQYLNQKYRSIQLSLRHAEEKLSWLKLLANSDLFWDPIAKIERIKHQEKYVYDLMVNNEVFLAGLGGMFVHNSYLVKLEILRSLMFGTEIIVIDPEAEYKTLCEAVNGEYITFGFRSPAKINPFDLSAIYEEGENELNLKILGLHSLFKVIMGQLNPTEEAVLDRALILTYKMKGITPEPATQNREPPLMEDLYKALRGMEEPQASQLADRIEKFVKGSFMGIFDQPSNVNIKNPFTVFSIRDLEETLRPIAMFIILDYIWTKIRREMKKRILLVDEAWYLMKYPDSASFMYSIAKRARKYYLGLTTITQDVEDFLGTDYGKAIVSNSSLQILMKQSSASIDKVAETFYLSEGEKQLLLSADVGEGLFFAGQNHVALRVVASPEEHRLVTTKPSEILAQAQNRPI
ncbi:hypothetical protein COT65_00140 [Candidatus Shapirobacteria bacterium CG09_land_8_20_14_0_10_47_13]|uniref:DOD-type homing endonuclease domain-containing protein n=1 Tax=Candidatus Shapirobacteria bacterium CG09_land_8_20_14_0_10_47_13 TaxID=1974481 RepID=A0A2H0WNK4_9BACT|nr:MAG: hypothetical protein COT65_00140 [Candidatus Shapirobacteria bacterium CG09_land_8_20_14_0_10_47_13]